MAKLIQRKPIAASLALLVEAVIILSCLTSCASTRDTSVTPQDPIDNAAYFLVRDLSSKIMNRRVSTIAIMEFEFAKKRGSEFQRKLLSSMVAHFGEQGNPRVLSPDVTNKTLSELKVSGPELKRLPFERREFSTRTRADAMLFGTIDESRDRLTVSCDLVSALDGLPIASSTIAIAKDEGVSRSIGLSVPSKLIIRSTSEDAFVYVDGEYVGLANQQGSVITVEKGVHTVRVSRIGYPSFEKEVHLLENSTEHLTVQFTSSEASLVVGSFFLGTILPGVPAWTYSSKDPQSNYAFAKLSALCFYFAGGMYLADRYLEPKFFTKGSKEKYESIKKIELYTAASSYLLNVIASILVGIDQGEKSRSVQEVLSLSPFKNENLDIYLAPVCGQSQIPGGGIAINLSLHIR
jgi:hypothetical protein